MPIDDDMPTDNQVADLLVKEANDYSLKYSAIGLDAFKSTKRPANQPKPNTRFLNNIIRGTNHHNRALQAKENAESQAKLRGLEDAEKGKRDEEERKLRKAKPGPSDTRKRMLGDIAAIIGGSPKKRRIEKTARSTTSAGSGSCLIGPGDGTRNPHRRHKNFEMKDEVDSTKKESARRNRLADCAEISRHTHRREETQDDGLLSSGTLRRKRRGRLSRRGSHRSSGVAEHPEHQSSPSADLSDSSPAEEIIGPVPVDTHIVRRRGRGANAATSGIDIRFAPGYDPRKDVTPESEDQRKYGDDDEWSNAVEAFRDRQKWNQQGAERLRSAGFTEEQIKKWEKGSQKNETDVQWTTVGCLREWDRGKVVNKDGTVSLEKDSKW